MNPIHDKDTNNIAECNLLHDILNPFKRTKNINNYDSPILNVFMDTSRGRAGYKNSQILLESGCSSFILMRRLTPEIKKRFCRTMLHTSR